MAKKNKQENFSFSEFLKNLENNSVTSPKEVEVVEERKYFLIVCEGERTEPLYFNYYKRFLPRDLMQTIEVSGEGDNTVNVVKKAIKVTEERKKNLLLPDFDEVWAVFDKDDFPEERYHEAINLAKRNGIESGHSNQSFELWYVLHFEYLQTALHRDDYIKILSKKLGFKYEKNDPRVIDIDFLFENGDVKKAIRWAEALEKMHEDKTQSESCPSTNVYKLIDSLRTYCKLT